jgi:hypothetical protein
MLYFVIYFEINHKILSFYLQYISSCSRTHLQQLNDSLVLFYSIINNKINTLPYTLKKGILLLSETLLGFPTVTKYLFFRVY